MLCTWKGCSNKATTPQIDSNGNEWANLCDDHHRLLDETLGDPKKIKLMLSYWVKAQGGAKAASRMYERR